MKLIWFSSFLAAIAITVSVFVAISALVIAAVPSLLRYSFDHTTFVWVAVIALQPVAVFAVIRALKKRSGFHCSSCGKQFFAAFWRNPFAHRCVHCGHRDWQT